MKSAQEIAVLGAQAMTVQLLSVLAEGTLSKPKNQRTGQTPRLVAKRPKHKSRVICF